MQAHIKVAQGSAHRRAAFFVILENTKQGQASLIQPIVFSVTLEPIKLDLGYKHPFTVCSVLKELITQVLALLLQQIASFVFLVLIKLGWVFRARFSAFFVIWEPTKPVLVFLRQLTVCFAMLGRIKLAPASISRHDALNATQVLTKQALEYPCRPCAFFVIRESIRPVQGFLFRIIAVFVMLEHIRQDRE